MHISVKNNRCLIMAMTRSNRHARFFLTYVSHFREADACREAPAV
jgi:hypothetical protein